MSSPVRIPADVEMADRVIGPLTARQLTILAVTGLVLYAGWTVGRGFLPLPVYLAVAIPVGAVAAILALGQRDGISLDRLVLAAIRQRMAPQHQVSAPEGVLPAPAWLTTHATTVGGAGLAGPLPTPAAVRLPATGVSGAGVIDLGPDGVALVAVAGTVNFALRTPAEQESLVAAFARYLHSLSGPVQVLIRTERLDLSGQIAELRDRAGGLPHPALEQAAAEHADYLARLAGQTDLLRRQVLLVLREPVQAAPASGLGGPPSGAILGSLRRRTARDAVHLDGARRGAEVRLVRRLAEAVELLGPAGITVTVLDSGQVTAVLAASCNPDSLLPPSAGTSGADEIVTTSGEPYYDPYHPSPEAANPDRDSGEDRWDEEDDVDDERRRTR
ncbi:MAG TPA: PrgI family protein [Actinokineospora sp.]|nr:PrgI family protein [Actinokineospora sp.]